MMSRKDYELIAHAIKSAIDDGYDRHELNGALARLVDALEDDNPRFDRATFTRAAGLVRKS